VCLASAAILLLMTEAWASQEGRLAVSSFRVESQDESGPVVVTGTQGREGPTSVRITAFGRETSLTEAQLQQLKGVSFNGIQLSSEGGYRELGGRTIYLQLSSGFTSGREGGCIVIVKERGDVQVVPSLSMPAADRK
jgi:hypothetical protein